MVVMARDGGIAIWYFMSNADNVCETMLALMFLDDGFST